MTLYTYEEQKANRELVADALCSDRFLQGQGLLKDENGGMCCLAVICELSELGEWEQKEETTYPKGDPVTRKVYHYLGERNYLPESVRLWIGFRDNCGSYKGDVGEGYTNRSLDYDNDNDDYTFKEIAEVIRSEPVGLCIPNPNPNLSSTE